MESFQQWALKWHSDPERQRRAEQGDPTLEVDWDEDRWQRYRALRRAGHQPPKVETSESKKMSEEEAFEVFFQLFVDNALTMQKAVRARIGCGPALSSPKERLPENDPMVAPLVKGARVAGLAMGPDAVVNAPIDILHPDLQRGILLEARHMRKDLLEGDADAMTVYGIDQPEVLKRLADVEKKAKAALLSWSTEQLREQDKSLVRGWQLRLRAEESTSSVP